MLISAHYSLTFLAGLQKEQATRTKITQRKNADFIFVGWIWIMKTVALAQNVSADSVMRPLSTEWSVYECTDIQHPALLLNAEIKWCQQKLLTPNSLRANRTFTGNICGRQFVHAFIIYNRRVVAVFSQNNTGVSKASVTRILPKSFRNT